MLAWYPSPFLPVIKCVGRAGKGLAPRVGSAWFRGMCNAGQFEATIVCVISSTNPRAMMANCKVCGNEVAPKEKRMPSSGARASVVCHVLTDLLLNSSSVPSPSVYVGYLVQEPAVLCRPCFTTKKYAEICALDPCLHVSATACSNASLLAHASAYKHIHISHIL